MSRFTTTALPLPGLVRVERQARSDSRGLFERLFCAEELAGAGWTEPVAQINHSLTRNRGSVRGMHYQRPPYVETKLVSCVHGAVWDVVVDVRSGSSTFLQWHAELLTPENGYAMLIPAGFAHGFQAQTDDARLLYCHSAVYMPAAEAGLHPLDPRLNIPWPLPLADLSERDSTHAWLSDAYEGVRL